MVGAVEQEQTEAAGNCQAEWWWAKDLAVRNSLESVCVHVYVSI